MTDNTPPIPSPEQPQQPPVAAQPLSDSDARLWVTLAHAGTIIFGFVPALIVWLIGKDRSKFVNDEAKEALNFAILLTIVYVVGWMLAAILIGFVILFAAFVMSLVFCIQGAMKANKGESYRYPLNLRLVK
jgi:hypothetical protein